MHDDATRLIQVLEQVTRSLSDRTGASAHLAVAHASATDGMSRLAANATTALLDQSQAFLRDVEQLRAHFDVIKTLAEKTALVRMQVLRLEAHVARVCACTTPFGSFALLS